MLREKQSQCYKAASPRQDPEAQGGRVLVLQSYVTSSGPSIIGRKNPSLQDAEAEGERVSVLQSCVASSGS